MQVQSTHQGQCQCAVYMCALRGPPNKSQPSGSTPVPAMLHRQDEASSDLAHFSIKPTLTPTSSEQRLQDGRDNAMKANHKQSVRRGYITKT